MAAADGDEGGTDGVGLGVGVGDGETEADGTDGGDGEAAEGSAVGAGVWAAADGEAVKAADSPEQAVRIAEQTAITVIAAYRACSFNGFTLSEIACVVVKFRHAALRFLYPFREHWTAVHKSPRIPEQRKYGGLHSDAMDALPGDIPAEGSSCQE